MIYDIDGDLAHAVAELQFTYERRIRVLSLSVIGGTRLVIGVPT